MEICDQGGCTARATRQITFDNGRSLWMCAHHCARAVPDLPAEMRFDDRHVEIVT